MKIARTITRVLPKINHAFYNVVIIQDVFRYEIACFDCIVQARNYARTSGGYLYNDKLNAA